MNTLLLSAAASGQFGTPDATEISGDAGTSQRDGASTAGFSDELKKLTSAQPHDLNKVGVATEDEHQLISSSALAQLSTGKKLPDQGESLPQLEEVPLEGISGEKEQPGLENQLVNALMLPLENTPGLTVDQVHVFDNPDTVQASASVPVENDTAVLGHGQVKAEVFVPVMPANMPVNELATAVAAAPTNEPPANRAMSQNTLDVLGRPQDVASPGIPVAKAGNLVNSGGGELRFDAAQLAMTASKPVATGSALNTTGAETNLVTGPTQSKLTVGEKETVIAGLVVQPDGELKDASRIDTKGLSLFAGLNSSAVSSSPGATTAVQPAQSAVPTLPLASGAAFGTQGWSDAVANRVMWLTDNRMMTAELRLDPPDLGPLQVKISINEGQAQVSFISQSSDVRGAIDQSLARLRELFNERNVELINVDISDHSSGKNAERESSFGASRTDSDVVSNSSFDENESIVDQAEPYDSSLQPIGMVDYYV
ncbi:MAG: flagellar hook-length control protein FliK [Proteobacteria bacterium]|nr:flagellar hook-length control protein FliK [Pseudomonadota bacterium]